MLVAEAPTASGHEDAPGFPTGGDNRIPSRSDKHRTPAVVSRLSSSAAICTRTCTSMPPQQEHVRRYHSERLRDGAAAAGCPAVIRPP